MQEKRQNGRKTFRFWLTIVLLFIIHELAIVINISLRRMHFKTSNCNVLKAMTFYAYTYIYWDSFSGILCLCTPTLIALHAIYAFWSIDVSHAVNSFLLYVHSFITSFLIQKQGISWSKLDSSGSVMYIYMSQ